MFRMQRDAYDAEGKRTAPGLSARIKIESIQVFFSSLAGKRAQSRITIKRALFGALLGVRLASLLIISRRAEGHWIFKFVSETATKPCLQELHKNSCDLDDI